MAQQPCRCSSYPNLSRKVGHRLGMGFQGFQHRPTAHILRIAHKGRIDPDQGGFQFMGLLGRILPQPRYLLYQAVEQEAIALAGAAQQRIAIQLHQAIHRLDRLDRFSGVAIACCNGNLQQRFRNWLR